MAEPAADGGVRGTAEMMKQAEKGMALFAKEAEVELDVAGAGAFKAEHEAAIKAKEDEAAALTGKENKKQRNEISKQVSALKVDPKYIDACKVSNGLKPPNGHFAKAAAAEAPAEAPKAAEEPAPAEAEAKKAPEKKEEKKPKKAESAGLSKAERDELEKLKKDLIQRKSELKEQGLSGGQCNKDEQVVAWVARMQELKIKEDPSLADGDKKKDDKKKAEKKKAGGSEEKLALEKKIEDYRLQLKAEFGYSDKDIKADPDMADMQKQLAKMK